MPSKCYVNQLLHRVRMLSATLVIGVSILGCQSIELVSIVPGGSNSLPVSLIGTNGRSVSASGRYVVFTGITVVSVTPEVVVQGDVYLRDTKDGITTKVSVDSLGAPGNGNSSEPVISNNGRFVAFESYADNLVPQDTNFGPDVFVHDRQTGSTTRVSVDSAGDEGNSSGAPSFNYSSPALSADGRFVAFTSYASNLVANDTNELPDGFVHDRNTGITTRFNVDSLGNQALGVNYGARFPAISDTGRYIAFGSSAINLVPDDTNVADDIFVHDRDTAITTRVHVNSAGEQSPSFLGAFISTISGTGRYVAFMSNSPDLVANDTNAVGDIFVHDRQSGSTTRVNVDDAGNEANAHSSMPFISGDGRHVSFSSNATNLDANDTDGARDIYVHDRHTEATWLVSESALGEHGNGASSNPAMSADGRYVVFDSPASNLSGSDFDQATDVFIKAITEVTVSGITPNMLPVGASTSVTVTGANFLAGTTPSINNTQISNIAIVDENTLTMDVTVASGTIPGNRHLLMMLPGSGPGLGKGSSGICVDCIQLF